MRLLWHGEWLETPAYAPVEDGELLSVEATAPLARVRDASGRIMRRPAAKVVRFVAIDGVRATYRKAKTKLTEARYSGDYRVVLVLGRSAADGRRCLALAMRMPPAAQRMLVHRELVRPVPDDVDAARLGAVARCLSDAADALGLYGRQTYLYSGQAPPQALVSAFAAAVDDAFVGDGSVGGVIEVPPADEEPATVAAVSTRAARGIPVAVLGAGDYARTEILPFLRDPLDRHVVADREPQVAAQVARAAGFRFATTDAQAAIESLPGPGVVYVATAHDSHAELAAAALRAGHRVFLEKPTVVDEDDLHLLARAIADTGTLPEVGFNRRHASFGRRAREFLAGADVPATITCVVKEVELEPHHWYLWPNQGSRVTGNACHWIDFGVYLLGGGRRPVSVTVSPQVSDEPAHRDEDRTVTVSFDEGSVLTIVATGRGDDILGVQELIEARRGDRTVLIDDFRRLVLLRDGRARRSRARRDKGHRRMYAEATARLREGRPSEYPLLDLLAVSAVQITAAGLVQRNETHDLVDRAVPGWDELARPAPAEPGVAAS